MNDIKRINATIVYIQDKLSCIREFEEKISYQLQSIRNCEILQERMVTCYEDIPTSHEHQERGDDEPWISLMNFYIHTQVISASCLGNMLRRNKRMFDACAKRVGKKYYVKKERTLQYLLQFSEGRILNNTNAYLKNREKECEEKKYTNSPPTKPLS